MPDNYFYKKLCLQIETCKIIFEALQRDMKKIGNKPNRQLHI